MVHHVLKFVGPKKNSSGEWSVNATQHEAALLGKTNAHGRALVKMIEGWADYARAFARAYDSSISSDGVIGEYWTQVGFAIKRLLDGETGGFDCGSLAHNITETIRAEGFRTNGYNIEREWEDGVEPPVERRRPKLSDQGIYCVVEADTLDCTYDPDEGEPVTVRAACEVLIPYGNDWIIVPLQTPGLHGIIGMDSDYEAETFLEESQTLREILASLGIRA